MGLDMYIERIPRYHTDKLITPDIVRTIELYFNGDILDEADDFEAAWEKWKVHHGVSLPSGVAYTIWNDYLSSDGITLVEDVCYWRKANAIHNWFVNNVQDGEDDCTYHREVTSDMLVDLLQTCVEVLVSCELVQGSDGRIVKDTSVAEKLLPSIDGFFFGDVDYDEWYVRSLTDTIENVARLLSTNDFEKYALFYTSSW